MEGSTEDSEFELLPWDSRNTGQETNLRRPFFTLTQTTSKTAKDAAASRARAWPLWTCQLTLTPTRNFSFENILPI